MLILVYPWRYSPVVLYGRWRRRGLELVAKGQSDKQPGSQTDCGGSTCELVPRDSNKPQDPVPMMPALTVAKTKLVRSGDPNRRV